LKVKACVFCVKNFWRFVAHTFD